MRISKASLFFFILGFNYIFLRAIVFPYFYDNFGSSGFIYINIIQVIIFLIFLLIPKRCYETDYYIKFKDSKIKYFYNIILFLRIIIGIGIGSYILHVLFFYNHQFFFIPIGIVLTILLISSVEPSEVIELATLFGITLLFSYIFYFYDFINLDFSLVFKDFSFKMDWMLVILILALVFDNFNYFIVDKNNLKFSKGIVISSLGLVMFLFCLEYTILTLSSGDKVFSNNPLSGFISLSIEPVSRYNGNFDYIYVLMILITSVFKYSFFLSTIRNSNNIRTTKGKLILLGTIIFLGVMGIYLLYGISIEAVKWIVITLFLLSCIIILWMLKENIYAKKI